MHHQPGRRYAERGHHSGGVSGETSNRNAPGLSLPRLCGIKLRRRFSPRTARQTMNERIIIDPELQHGKPVIRGTRVPVTRILGGLAGGMTFDEICREYDVSAEDIRAT